jgi:hypothetical protein
MNDYEINITEVDTLDKTFWENTYKKLLWGLLFTSFTINAWYLNYILPSLGYIWLLIAMRRLHKKNQWFLVGYYFAGIEVIEWSIRLILNATVDIKLGLLIIIITIGYAIRIVLMVILYNAFGVELTILGKTNRRYGIILLTVNYSFLMIIEQTQLRNYVPLLLLFALILMISLHNMRRMFETVEEWGYQLLVDKAKNSDIRITWALLSIMFVGTVGASIIAHTDLSKGVEITADNGVTSETDRKRLIDMGVPSEIANDLRKEDLIQLEDCDRCITYTDRLTIEGCDVDVANVVFRLSKGVTKAIIYFEWNKVPDLYYEDVMNVESRYYLQPLGGAILFSVGEREYRKNYAEMDNINQFDRMKMNPIFPTEVETEKYIYAICQFPLRATKHRGYLLYSYNMKDGDLAYNIIFIYYRRMNPIQIPYKKITNLNEIIFSNKVQQVYYCIDVSGEY